MSKKLSVYELVVRQTRRYFGTDAPQHIAKLIDIHLGKSPEDLTREELMSLIDWIRAAVSFLAEDKDTIEKYIAELFDLANSTLHPYEQAPGPEDDDLSSAEEGAV